MKKWIIKSPQEFCWEIQSEPKAEGRLWREFVAEHFFVVIFISSASWAQPEHLDSAIMSNCAQIVFRPQESLHTVVWVSLFRLTLPVLFSLCCTPTLSTFLSLSLTLIHMQVSFCSLLLYLTNIHCTRPPAAAEPTPSTPFFISYPLITCRAFSASSFCLYSPLYSLWSCSCRFLWVHLCAGVLRLRPQTETGLWKKKKLIQPFRTLSLWGCDLTCILSSFSLLLASLETLAMSEFYTTHSKYPLVVPVFNYFILILKNYIQLYICFTRCIYLPLC